VAQYGKFHPCRGNEMDTFLWFILSENKPFRPFFAVRK